ncbi:unnamed protein product, partial [marine sediment metagenome]
IISLDNDVGHPSSSILTIKPQSLQNLTILVI